MNLAAWLRRLLRLPPPPPASPPTDWHVEPSGLLWRDLRPEERLPRRPMKVPRRRWLDRRLPE